MTRSDAGGVGARSIGEDAGTPTSGARSMLIASGAAELTAKIVLPQFNNATAIAPCKANATARLTPRRCS
jgi:hypothetical protein